MLRNRRIALEKLRLLSFLAIVVLAIEVRDQVGASPQSWVVGRVTDVQGTPIVGARVYVFQAQAVQAEPILTLNTDQFGVFIIKRVDPSIRHTIWVRHRQFIPYTLEAIDLSTTEKIPITLQKYTEQDSAQTHAEKNSVFGSRGPILAASPIASVPEILRYGRKFAIVIGVSDYKYLPKTSEQVGALVDLKYAEVDARAFADLLQDPAIAGDDWQLSKLIGQSASLASVRKALDRVFLGAKEDDLIVLYFAGHGRSHPQIPDAVYLLMYDSELDDPRSGLEYEDLIRDLIKTRANHVIAFIDACRSGVVGFGAMGDVTPPFKQDLLGSRRAEFGQQKVIFSSGESLQSSWEDRFLEKGVFTHFLIEGMKGAAPEYSNPKFVDLRELADFVEMRVSEHTSNNLDMIEQRPRLWGVDGVVYDNYPIALRSR